MPSAISIKPDYSAAEIQRLMSNVTSLTNSASMGSELRTSITSAESLGRRVLDKT
jgi:hypothetical protein